jgi:hypothetical protein
MSFSGTKSGRTILTFVLVGMLAALISCIFTSSPSYVPSGLTPEPILNIVDGYPAAEAVALNWDPGSYLVSVASGYEPDSASWRLVHAHYIFVEESKEMYLGVTIKPSGSVETNGPDRVQGSDVTSSDYSLKKNILSEEDALELAWSLLGSKLAAECGPIETLSIKGSAFGNFWQDWHINYWGQDWILGSIALNAENGEILGDIEVNQNFCDLSLSDV